MLAGALCPPWMKGCSPPSSPAILLLSREWGPPSQARRCAQLQERCLLAPTIVAGVGLCLWPGARVRWETNPTGGPHLSVSQPNRQWRWPLSASSSRVSIFFWANVFCSRKRKPPNYVFFSRKRILPELFAFSVLFKNRVLTEL